jgi:hypothetical protein
MLANRSAVKESLARRRPLKSAASATFGGTASFVE